MTSQNQPISAHRGAVTHAEPPRPDFEVVNARGVVLCTTPDIDLARQEARRKAVTFPGVRVIQVRRLEERTVVFTPRPTLVRTA